MSSTQSWAVTTQGSLLTWLWALNPSLQEAAGTGSPDGGQESFHSSSAPPPLWCPPNRSRPLSPYLRVSATCKLCQRSPAGARGLSLCDSRVPLGAPALWAPSQLPAAAVASRKAETGFSFSPPRLLLAGPRVYFSGCGARDILRASSGKVEECTSWIAAAATAVAWDEEAVGDASWRAGEAGGGERK